MIVTFLFFVCSKNKLLFTIVKSGLSIDQHITTRYDYNLGFSVWNYLLMFKTYYLGSRFYYLNTILLHFQSYITSFDISNAAACIYMLLEVAVYQLPQRDRGLLV